MSVQIVCLPLFQTPSFHVSPSFTCLSVILLKGGGSLLVCCSDFSVIASDNTPPDPPHLILQGCCECIRTFFLPFKPSPQLVSFVLSALPISLSPHVLLRLNVIVLIIIYQRVHATTVLVCCGHLCPVRCPPPCAFLPCLCWQGGWRGEHTGMQEAPTQSEHRLFRLL